MFGEEDDIEKKKFSKIDLEGNDRQLWGDLRSKLFNMILSLMELKVNYKTDGNVEEEFTRVTTNIIEFANAKLEKPSIENQKLLAEIDHLLANRAREFAQARKLSAEAEKIELDNLCKKLSIAIGAAKVLARSSNDEETLIFVKNIQELSFIFQEDKFLE